MVVETGSQDNRLAAAPLESTPGPANAPGRRDDGAVFPAGSPYTPRSMGGVLAIDHGTRVSGFASTDSLRIATSALPAVRAPGDSDALLDHLERLVAERDVDVLLVGLPLDGKGQDTARSKDVRRFARRAAQRLPSLAVCGWDEHLTTRAARELLVEEGVSKRKRQELRDSYAALVLLRDWMAAGEPRTHTL